MKKTFIKTIFRDFKKNFTRLIAIVAIMALGVGFLIGLLSATPDLQNSMEEHYDQQNMYDLWLKSTIGFDEENVESLKEDFTEIEDILPFTSFDYKSRFEGKDIITRVVTTPLQAKMNQIELIAGRLPEQENECVIHNMGIFLDSTPLNKELQIDEKTYKIVGVCNSPVYYYRMEETTQLGAGKLEAILYLDQRYHETNYTDVCITLKGAKRLNSFKKAYFTFLKPTEDKIEIASTTYIQQRIERLYQVALKEAEVELKENNPLLPDEMIQSLLEQIAPNIKEQVDARFTETKWYILNRKANMSYVSFDENSIKVNRVAIVFPFFFFFIAALIALTSVTRLVSEDRSSIGTLKSLGYSNLRILNKYFIYAVFACVIGTVGGLFLGVYGIPMVIYYCYNSLFIMPKGHFIWHSDIVLLSSLSMSITIFLVMIIVCLKALRERPNALLVPKAPRAGKRILLERIGVLWKRLKFKYKSSIRNIFRFKRNLIMMVVGIGGCSGLMLVGLGLRDSMNGVSKVQFGEILTYDFNLTVQSEMKLDFLKDSKSIYLYKEDGQAVKDKDYEIEILYTDDSILSFMNLGLDELPQNQVVISSDLASRLHLRKGNSIEVEVSGNHEKFVVGHIYTNYVKNYIIVNQKADSINTMLIQLGEKDLEDYDDIVKKLYEQDGIITIENLAQTKELYTSLSNGIDLVIILIIFLCGLLAIIVIYNLTNININERVKEIATLKVLGYQKFEVLGYIYREILMMGVLGILFGFVLGPLLNLFVMKQISSPGQCFPLTIQGWNFLYAFLITLLFMGIVLLLFIPKMKRIKMVESLKSVE